VTAAERPRAWALAFATGVIVTIEFSAVGLLPDLARGLGVSLDRAGWLVGGFALASCLAGPPLTLLASRTGERRALIASLGVFAGGNLLAAVAPSYGLVLAARVAEGAVLPVFVSLAIATLMRAAPGRPQAHSLGLLNGAVVVGTLIALPATVVLAGQLDWRAGFATLGALALLAMIAVGRSIAADPAGRESPAPIGGRVLVAQLSLSAGVFAALFASYTYLAAWREQAADLATAQVGAALAGFALAGLAGNAVAARTADAAPLAATMVAVGLFVGVMAALASSSPLTLAPIVALWGAVHAGLFVICQTRVLHAAPDAPAFASALNIAACNLGIAIGSATGGWAVTRHGLGALGWSAAAMGLGALALAAAVGLLSPRRPRRPRSP
jgi:predicted MFS family arabinose efflux permease